MRPTRWERFRAWRPSLPLKIGALLVGCSIVVVAAVVVVASYFLGYWGHP